MIRAEDTFEAWMIRRHAQQVSERCGLRVHGRSAVGFINAICGRRDVVCVEARCQAMGNDVFEFELLPVYGGRRSKRGGVQARPDAGRQLNLLEMLFERMPMGIAIFDRKYRSSDTTLPGRIFPSGTRRHRLPVDARRYYFDLLPGSGRL